MKWMEYREVLAHYGRYLHFLRPFWGGAAIVLFFMVLSLAVQFPTPLIVRHIFDVVLPDKDISAFFVFAGILLGIALGKTISGLLSDRILANYRERAAMFTRTKLFDHVLGAKMAFFDQHQAGYIKSRIDEDVDQVDSMLYENIPNLVIQILTFVGGLVICLMISKLLTTVVLVSIIPYVLIFHHFTGRIYKLTMDNHEAWAHFQGFVVELVGKVSLIKLFSGIGPANDAFRDACKKPLASNKDIELEQASFEAAMNLITALIPLLVLLLGIIEAIYGRFTTGGIIAFSSSMTYLFGPTTILVNMNVNLSKSLVSAKRIFEIMDLPRESLAFGNNELKQVDSISFKDTAFYYSENRGLDRISFTVKRGQSLCVIGASGAGKSTLGYLLTGLRLPSSGSVCVNNQPIHSFSLESLRAKIGYVPQEPLLFSGSIRDNLYLENSEISEDELLRMAMLETWVGSLPEGLDTYIHENGVGLSGGEKQRIALARALAVKPDILFLDEVTSALDPENETKVLGNLLGLPWQPAMICITHRQSLANQFDQVVQL